MSIQPAWQECLDFFGAAQTLIVRRPHTHGHSPRRFTGRPSRTGSQGDVSLPQAGIDSSDAIKRRADGPP
jgi:hypothetical protein